MDLMLSALKRIPGVLPPLGSVRVQLYDPTTNETTTVLLAFFEKMRCNLTKITFTLPIATIVARELLLHGAELVKAGIAHRDIKPENVYISDTGEVKIGDLGGAVFVDEDGIPVINDPSYFTVAYQSADFLNNPAKQNHLTADCFAIVLTLLKIFGLEFKSDPETGGKLLALAESFL